jgi:hypothetical protein
VQTFLTLYTIVKNDFFLIDDEIKDNLDTNIDNETLTNQDLVIPQYTLTQGLKTVIFNIQVKDEENSSVVYKSNMAVVFINIKRDMSNIIYLNH